MKNLTILFCFLLLLKSPLFAQSLNDKIFQNPTQEYGIRCWWWWLNGNVTKEAITRDLEEMKAKGFSGACIFDAGGHDQRGNGDIPEGPLWGSAAWRDLYLYAINEAERLNLVMSLSIQSGWNLGGPDVTPDEATKQVVFSEMVLKGGSKVNQQLDLPKIRDNYFQDIAVVAYPFKKIDPKRPPILDFDNKSAKREVGWSVPETRPLLSDTTITEGEENAKFSEVINITQHFKNGVLDWDAPVGDWVVLRLGYTTTDAHVSTSSGKWQGRVLDYLSEKHFNRYWDTHVEPLLKMIGNRAGRVLRYLQTDSFEGGGMNWTDGFENEFKTRRGYDLTPYLPILAGKIIENRDITARFLNDFRKTIGDLVSDKHYRLFAERSKKYGIGIQPESAGPHAGPFDGLKNYGHSEIMMSEFWSPSPHRSKPIDRFFVKQAASAAKIYNQKLVGAESFTTIGPHWNDVIWSNMKSAADHEFCAGLNLIYLHTFTCSPKEMGIPGQEYFAGTHFNPQVTWWNKSTAFIQYLSRIHYIMQAAPTQADVLYYYGDHVPNIGRYKEDDPAGALPDFDYDLINEDKLLELQVKNGRLVLPHGASYRILALPNHQILSLAVLKKIKSLVTEGATIVGTKTLTTASLVGYPNAEKTRAEIVAELWGNAESETQNTEGGKNGEKQTGKGRMIWGKTAKEVLLNDNFLPDCEILDKPKDQLFDWIHRKLGETDYYFISNQNKTATQIRAAFRITGKQPELWNAVTGEIRPLNAFVQANGRTIIPLNFDPYGSCIVVFRTPIKVIKGRATSNFFKDQIVQTLEGSWDVSFDTKWGSPASVKFDKLESWKNRSEEGIKYYSGTAIYRKKFNFMPKTQNNTEGGNSKGFFLDLGDIQDVGIAKVKLNGKDLGIVWTPPFRVNVSGLLKKENNILEIEVTNSWRNRLVGDRGKPQNERFTKTNVTIKPEWELLDAGLLGPVQVLKN